MLGRWRSLIVAGARSQPEPPARIGAPDAMHMVRHTSLACILGFYFLTLGCVIGWLVAVVCRQVCETLMQSCGTGGAAVCGVAVLALSIVGVAFFFIFGIASVPMLGCILAVFGPPLVVLGVSTC